MKHNSKISFIIISNGERQNALRNLVSSIQYQSPWRCQIVLVGDVMWLGNAKTTLIEAKDEAARGRISILKNKGADAATGEILCFFDDDISLERRWFDDIQPLMDRLSSGALDFGGCRVIGPNGSRWYDWSWASRSDANCPSVLFPYDKKHPNLYLSGCCLIANSEAFAKIRFNENQGYYQREDIDFSHRCWDAGMRLACYNKAQITHLLLPSGRSEKKREYESYFQESIYKYRCGDLASAKEHLEKSKAAGLDVDLYQYTVGLYLYFSHDFDAAQKLFRSVLERGTASVFHRAQSHYRLGTLLLRGGHNHEAEQHFRETVQIVPEHPMARFRLDRL